MKSSITKVRENEKLNNRKIDTANLRRLIEGVYQPNWFQDSFYEEVKELIDTFEKAETTKKATDIVREIYKVSLKAFKKAEINFNKLEQKEDAKKELKLAEESLLDIGIIAV
jgi:ABC-type phosphate transport system ATPase subunit